MIKTHFSPDFLNQLVQQINVFTDCSVWLLDIRKMPILTPEDIIEILHNSSVLRYNELSRNQRRKQFVIGRLLMKYAVSKLLNRPIQEFAMIEQRGNAPCLRAIPPIKKPLYYSLAYRYDYAACAISHSHLIGLDIEIADASREISIPTKIAFNQNENNWLESKPAKESCQNYYELWTRKEACYKLLSARFNGIHNDLFWQIDCLTDKRFQWKTLYPGNDLLVTVCQSDPSLKFTLPKSSSYDIENASNIFNKVITENDSQSTLLP